MFIWNGLISFLVFCVFFDGNGINWRESLLLLCLFLSPVLLNDVIFALTLPWVLGHRAHVTPTEKAEAGKQWGKLQLTFPPLA